MTLTNGLGGLIQSLEARARFRRTPTGERPPQSPLEGAGSTWFRRVQILVSRRFKLYPARSKTLRHALDRVTNKKDRRIDAAERTLWSIRARCASRSG